MEKEDSRSTTTSVYTITSLVFLFALLTSAYSSWWASISCFVFCSLLIWRLVGFSTVANPVLESRIIFVSTYAVFILPILGADSMMVRSSGFLWSYSIMNLVGAGILTRLIPRDVPGAGAKENEKAQASSRAGSHILYAAAWSLVILITFYILARHGDSLWLTVRPVGHHLLLLLPASLGIGKALMHIFTVRRRAATLPLCIAVILLTLVVPMIRPHKHKPGPVAGQYLTLLNEVVAKRDWLLSEEGRTTSYDEKSKAMSLLDARFSNLLHLESDNGKLWLLRGILTRLRSDSGASRLDPLCFDKAAEHLSETDDLTNLFPENERWFFEEATASLIDLQHPEAARLVAEVAPQTDWGDVLRKESETTSPASATEASPDVRWPVRGRIGRVADLIGFSAVKESPETDPRGKIQVMPGKPLSFDALIRLRRQSVLHAKQLRLFGKEGINTDLPWESTEPIEGKPGEIVRIPIRLDLPPLVGPIPYEAQLVFQETGMFPPGPLILPLTVLDVFPRLVENPVNRDKVKQLYGDVAYEDLGYRTVIGPDRGVNILLPKPVETKGIILVSGLTYDWSARLNEQAAEILLIDEEYKGVRIPIRAGMETGSMYPTRSGQVSSYGTVPVWTSYPQDPKAGPESAKVNQYHRRIDLEKPVTVSRVELGITGKANLFLNVFHVLLVRANE